MKFKLEHIVNSLFDNNVTLVELVILFLAVVLLQYIIRIFLNYFIKRAENRQHWWNASILKAMRWPLGIAIWWLFITYFLDFIAVVLPVPKFLFTIVEPARQLGIIACLLWFVISFINRIEAVYVHGTSGKRALDATTVRAIARLSKVTTSILGVLIILETMGISIAGLVTFGGIGAAGIAFAAKDILGNFFGGLLLYSTRPFAVGDVINSPDRNIEGTVEEIGWLFTRIRNGERRPMTVPNGLFSDIIVVNQSRMSHRRINETIALRYQDANQIAAITASITTMLQQHKDIDKTTIPTVSFNKFADSSLNILVTAYTNVIDNNQFLLVQQDVFLKIIAIISEHGAECAFPTRTIELLKDPV